MIGALLRTAAWLDGWLQDKVGEPYRTLLGVGLAIEIARRVRDIPELLHADKGIVGDALSLLLFVALF